MSDVPPGEGARPGGRRLLVVSSGSYDASIVGRNALERMRTLSAERVFDEVHYVFFRVPAPAERRVDERITVHEVSGDPPVPLLGRLPLVRPVALTLGGLSEIRRIAERVRPDAVTTVDPFLSGFLGWRVARGLGVPLVVTLVSNYLLSWKAAGVHPMPALPPALAFGLEKTILRRADLVMVDCRHYAGYAVERGVPRERVWQVPRFADPLFHEGRPEAGRLEALVGGDGPVLVYVGRLSPEKYAFDLLEAFRETRQRVGDVRLLVVGGGGPLHEPFLERSEALGLRDAITVATGLDRGAMLSVLAAADAVLAPHAGYALLEAALAGAPIVAYDYEWHPELIRSEQNGILVPYRDASAMGRAAAGLLADPERARALGRAARAEALDAHGLDRIRESLREGYGRVLGDEP